MSNNSVINFLWNALITLGMIFGVVNIVKAFQKPDVSALEEYEKIIKQKDEIIKQLEQKVEIYQKIINNDYK